LVFRSAAGWPEIRFDVARADGAVQAVRCTIAHDREALAPLRRDPRPTRPRVRVVGAVAGAALADRVELVSDHAVVRLRPAPAAAPAKTTDDAKRAAAKTPPAATTAAPIDVTGLDAGLFDGTTVTLAPGVTVTATDRGARVDSTSPQTARLLVADRGAAAPRWRRITALPAELTGVAVLVVDEGARHRAWMLRAAPAGTSVPPLLADDVGAGRDLRRHYVYGGSLPELGWTNPYDVRHSLGLDGWIQVALAEKDTHADPEPTCGTLAPPRDADAVPQRVCAPSPSDGVMECAIAVAPDLELDLRALLELAALDPKPFGKNAVPATRAALVVLRGDTGEILASADFVPGRGSPVYAPGTPAVEAALQDLREQPGESSAEKHDRHRAIAIGSTFKPFVARAAEKTAPDLTRNLQVAIDPNAPRLCKRGSRHLHDLLGHCPPRELLDDGHGAGWLDLHTFLATSSNPFQALLGLAAPGWPDGHFRAAGIEIAPRDVLQYAPTGWTEPLEVERADRHVIGPRGVRVDALRATPFWQHLEALLGRPTCTLGSGEACARAADRRDVCAARALRVTNPTADLRHLVSLGPSTFDMYPAGARDAAVVPITEYFQLLRGSAVHPVGSLAQLTDAFNRLVFDGTPSGAYQLAASWFPVPATGRLPEHACTRTGGRDNAVLGDGGGLCGVLRSGTGARAFADLLDSDTIVLYGAKTGTIDTLGDVVERRRACEAWNKVHTVDGKQQPYHLDCGRDVADDSLFVISLGVKDGDRTIPLTIGLQLERTGKGVAAQIARRIVEYLAVRLGGTR
jgi:hypothetical protein